MQTLPFRPRPPITSAHISACKRDFRKQRFLRIHLKYLPTTSNPRCARFRLWQKEARMRRRQLKLIHSMMQHISHAVRESECSLALFSEAAWHHNVSVRSAESGEVFQRPLKRPRSPSPTATLHTDPLRQYSIHDRHLIARALKSQPRFLCTVPNCMVATADGALRAPKDFFRQPTGCYALLWSDRQPPRRFRKTMLQK